MTDAIVDAPDAGAGLRIAMIGPLPPPVGGTTVSFDALCRFLRSKSCDCIVIDTAPRRGGVIAGALSTVAALLRVLNRSDVVTAHVSDRAAITIAPILWAVCRLRRKPFIYRQFGGGFGRTFSSLSRGRQWLVAKTIFRSDAVFLQTKAMIQQFAPLSQTLHWFPTARQTLPPAYRGRFGRGEDGPLRCLFFGHVSEAKGILLAAQGVNAVPIASLDVYGPLIDVAEEAFAGARIRYCGIASPGDVASIMQQYDVLLFPTSHIGEGYSGTLVEAAMIGLPMIITRWQSLPEMFMADEAIFIEPNRADQVADALNAIAAAPGELLVRSRRLVARATDFDADRTFSEFLKVCEDFALRGKA